METAQLFLIIVHMCKESLQLLIRAHLSTTLTRTCKANKKGQTPLKLRGPRQRISVAIQTKLMEIEDKLHRAANSQRERG